MAHAQKSTSSPNVTTPYVIADFMEGFSAATEQEAMLVFEHAVRPISKSLSITKHDLQSCYAHFRIINPQDDIERLWCATFIVGHLLGMYKLQQQSPKDKRIGLNLLKAADDAIERIYKKRNGITPNITT